ncbi:MAG: crossover junction endodeoxyribonuclease RuvC [Lentisphaerae bacterium GWF2_52_8]|nr:MAG: crossover junction endodeoxyribonuclease RuvC [Lentisphaerae bacterium GWF2_52_8]
MLIIGIDTAIRCTGYGVVEMSGVNRARILDCGVIKNGDKLPHSECLRRIAGGIGELITRFKPEVASIEDAFYGKNIKTAMILSLARGAAITVAAQANIPIYAYSPRSAKKAVVGTGAATKQQVALMIAAMLELDVRKIPLDSTDALALALAHGQIAMRPELKMLLPKPL